VKANQAELPVRSQCETLKVSTSGYYDWLDRDNHLRGVSRRRSWCVTTARNPRQRPAPDLVDRKFVASDINQLWVADMTYVPTWEGFLYLAVVTDVFSRKVVGWAFGVHMTSELVIAALDMALFTRQAPRRHPSQRSGQPVHQHCLW
jgi:putative transposase